MNVVLFVQTHGNSGGFDTTLRSGTGPFISEE
mgnify:CR=1 FL=1